MVQLTLCQRNVVNAVVGEKGNFAIVGSAGVGKSVIIEEIYQRLLIKNVNCVKTASTGLAATHIGGQTVHRFTGVGDGRFSKDSYASAILQIPEKLEELRKLDVLIIDEVSMISADIIDKIDAILRSARGCDLVFGGARVILVGDLLQLPPVPSHYDEGRYVFQSRCWPAALFTKVVLTESHRQNADEDNFLRCIQETSTGSLTAQSEQILKSRDKQLESVEDKLILCCSNRVAALINGKNLRKNNNPMRSYKAEDSQRNSPLLRKFTSAEDKLRLKVGAPILVTANINQYLFNGTRGVVTHLDNDCITIVVNGNEHKIDRYVFDLSTYSRAVTRKQFPIKLAYAITIHRSQGMTLESYHIDCEDMFLTQQLYVALSRACSVNSFTVSNLDMTDIIPCNAVVTAFLEGQEDEYEVSDSDSDSDMDCDVDSSEPSSGNCPELGSEQEVTDFLITIATGATDHKEILNVWNKVTFSEQVIKELGRRQPDLCRAKLIANLEAAKAEASKIMLDQKSHNTADRLKPPPLSDSSRGRVRYIGASIIRRIKDTYQAKELESAYQPEECSTNYAMMTKITKLLIGKKYSLLQVSNDPNSLKDTLHRETKSLTWITDAAADFFYSLHQEMTSEFQVLKRCTPEDTYFKLTHEENASKAAWMSLYAGQPFDNESLTLVYNQVVYHYTKMKTREVRRCVRRKIQKTRAHRIQVESAKGSTQQVKEKITSSPAPEPAEEIAMCGVCDQEEADNPDDRWIACDECKEWIHFTCSELTEQEYADIDEEQWSCPMCSAFFALIS